MVVKLFEQWIAEEDKADDSVKISVKSNEAGQFEIMAKDDDEVSNQFAKSYKVISSTNSSIKPGASLMVSPTIDKEGDFEVVVVNDPKTGEDILNYSGGVTID
jgi:hypothetical protein